MAQLSQQVIWITGAGTGLGRELAILLAQEGATVIACGRRVPKIEKLKEELQLGEDKFFAKSVDVSQEQEVKTFIEQVISRFGRIDVVINNAAVFENSSILETSLESWKYQFDNNTLSTFIVSRECLPIMRKQKAGQIINLTSRLAQTGGNGFAAYSATKAAIEAFTFSLDEEERQNGIIAHVVNPGVMKTHMQAIGSDPSHVAKKLVRLIKENRQPTGRVVDLDQE